MHDDVRAFMDGHRPGIEAALERSVAALAQHVPPAVHAAVRAGALSGGKRIRPLLLVAACRETGGPGDDPALYDLAASVEAVHAYSLMQDDLPCMDDASLRRGRPAVHVAHGPVAASAGGAALIPWAALRAYEAAGRLGRTDAESRRIAACLLDAAGAGGMVGGQALDLLAEGASLSEGELAGVHRLKTGALLRASLEMGGLAAGAPARSVAALCAFGRDLGLAFQVMDDVLDATGSAETLGKRPSDVAFNKSTYVAFLGVQGARDRAAALVARGLGELSAAGMTATTLRQIAHLVRERRR